MILSCLLDMRSFYFDQLVARIIPFDDLLHGFTIFREFFHEIEFLLAHHSGIVVDGVPRLQEVLAAIPASLALGFVIVDKFLGDVLYYSPQTFFSVRLQPLGVGSSVLPYFF